MWEADLLGHKGQTDFIKAYQGSELVWEKQQENYLCFTANTAGSTVGLENINGEKPDIKYSRDGVNWTQWDYSKITLANAGDKVYMKGNNPNGFSVTERGYNHFYFSGSVAASGSIMSLIDEKGVTRVIPNERCFTRLFSSGKYLTTAPELPATTLTTGCYSNMFAYCTGLVSPPKLPATTMAENCYLEMFIGCSSLETAPELHATTLARGCYCLMFKNCKSITRAPELPVSILIRGCYSQMFVGCSSLNYIKCLATDISADYVVINWTEGVSPVGTFIKTAGVEWPIGVNGIPSGWTVEEV